MMCWILSIAQAAILTSYRKVLAHVSSTYNSCLELLDIFSPSPYPKTIPASFVQANRPPGGGVNTPVSVPTNKAVAASLVQRAATLLPAKDPEQVSDVRCRGYIINTNQ